MKTEQLQPLDAEEKALMESLEAGEWQAMDKTELKATKALLENSAKETRKQLRMEKKQITIKLGISDIEFVKAKAQETGISYQNIISALVHNYTVGKVKLEI